MKIVLIGPLRGDGTAMVSLLVYGRVRGTVHPFLASPTLPWRRSSCVGQQAFFDEHRRPAVTGSLLIGVGPTEQVAVFPRAS